MEVDVDIQAALWKTGGSYDGLRWSRAEGLKGPVYYDSDASLAPPRTRTVPPSRLNVKGAEGPAIVECYSAVWSGSRLFA